MSNVEHPTTSTTSKDVEASIKKAFESYHRTPTYFKPSNPTKRTIRNQERRQSHRLVSPQQRIALSDTNNTTRAIYGSLRTPIEDVRKGLNSKTLTKEQYDAIERRRGR